MRDWKFKHLNGKVFEIIKYPEGSTAGQEGPWREVVNLSEWRDWSGALEICQLLSAAPELLKALERALDHGILGNPEATEQAREAVRKAKGYTHKCMVCHAEGPACDSAATPFPHKGMQGDPKACRYANTFPIAELEGKKNA